MKKIIAVFVVIVSVLALVLAACSSAPATTVTSTVTATTTKTVSPTTTTSAAPAGDKVYKALNPAGNYIPVETKPCAPRLDTVDGKVIFVYQSEGSSIIMPAVWRAAQKKLTKSVLTTELVESFGRNTPSENDLKVQAAIRGVSW